DDQDGGHQSDGDDDRPGVTDEKSRVALATRHRVRLRRFPTPLQPASIEHRCRFPRGRDPVAASGSCDSKSPMNRRVLLLTLIPVAAVAAGNWFILLRLLDVQPMACVPCAAWFVGAP